MENECKNLKDEFIHENQTERDQNAAHKVDKSVNDNWFSGRFQSFDQRLVPFKKMFILKVVKVCIHKDQEEKWPTKRQSWEKISLIHLYFRSNITEIRFHYGQYAADYKSTVRWDVNSQWHFPKSSVNRPFIDHFNLFPAAIKEA